MMNDTWGDWGDGGFHTMMEDEHSLTKLVREKYPDLPYFLFGHSMALSLPEITPRPTERSWRALPSAEPQACSGEPRRPKKN